MVDVIKRVAALLGFVLLVLVARVGVVEATASSGTRATFQPLAPARILDTRGGPKVGAGTVVEVLVRGQGGVAPDATAVVLNVTATEPTATSHLTVYPAGTQAPAASSLNFVAGQTVPNAVTVPVGANGKVAIRNDRGGVHVIVDVNGFYRDHDHDDRYDTKAKVDDKIDAAQDEPGIVRSAQVVDGSLRLTDLGTRHTIGGRYVALADGDCTTLQVSTGGGSWFLLPEGLEGVSQLTVSPAMSGPTGTARVPVCNWSGSPYAGTGLTLAYWLIAR